MEEVYSISDIQKHPSFKCCGPTATIDVCFFHLKEKDCIKYLFCDSCIITFIYVVRDEKIIFNIEISSKEHLFISLYLGVRDLSKLG